MEALDSSVWMKWWNAEAWSVIASVEPSVFDAGEEAESAGLNVNRADEEDMSEIDEFKTRDTGSNGILPS